MNFVIIKTAPICGAKGDEHHAEYSSVTPPNSPRVARITFMRDLCTANKQNRTQALVCKNHERSITLETMQPTESASSDPSASISSALISFVP